MKPQFPPPPLSLSLENATILGHIKEGYLLWVNISEHIPKGQRYTIGTRIESKFLNLLELSYTAYFTEKEKKQVKVQDCIHATDVLKFLIHVAWEAKFISHKQYAEIIPKLEAIGKMFGGWKKNIDQGEKKNRNQ